MQLTGSLSGLQDAALEVLVRSHLGALFARMVGVAVDLAMMAGEGTSLYRLSSSRSSGRMIRLASWASEA